MSFGLACGLTTRSLVISNGDTGKHSTCLDHIQNHIIIISHFVYKTNISCRGCVSGFQLQGLRNLLVDPEEPDTYRWDRLDGYDGDEKNSLDKHPDLQEKVRRAVENGCIDPEEYVT